MKDVQGKTVVLLGGESAEREVSLNSGNCIAQALREEGIEVETYDWLPEKMEDFLSRRYGCAYIALHGGSGEDGRVQSMLALAGIPYTGVRPRAAANGMDKHLSKIIVRGSTDVPVPDALIVPASEALASLARGEAGRWGDVLARFGLPLIVKPARNGSSVGVTLVREASALDEAVRRACVSPDELVMFEQYIGGYELTVALLNGRALGVCQILPKNDFYDWDAKYQRNDTEYLTPSSLGTSLDARLCEMAVAVARALDCTQGVVRADFLADRDLNPYFLEINTVPGMTSHSLVPKIAHQAGIPFGRLCVEVLSGAMP